MSYRIFLCLLCCGICEATAYGQRVQEVHAESTDSENKETREQSLDLAQIEQLIFKKTNQLRAKEKRTQLKSNEQLNKAAKSFAEFLAKSEKFSHSADNQEPWDRTKKAGYEHSIILENIAYEQSTRKFTAEELATDFEDGWEASPGHRKNLLDPDVQEIGIGIGHSAKTGRYYAVQNFGRPKSEAIIFKVSNQLESSSVKLTVDDRPFTIGPRETVTYERARPPKLHFVWNEQANVSSDAKSDFRPANGTSYVIRMTDDEITVE